MLRTIDAIASHNRWHAYSDAVALLCFGLMVDVLLLPPLSGAPLILGATALLAIVWAKVPWVTFGRGLLVPIGFLALGSIGLYPSLTLQGVLGSGLRAWAATSVTLLFAFTVPMAHLFALLKRWKVPPTLIELLGLVYRSLFVLDEARRKVIFAQRSRLGYRNWSTSLRSTGLLASCLFVRALTQSLRWERGLGARGYRGELQVLPPVFLTRARHRWAAVAVFLGLAILHGLGWVLCSQ